MVATVRIDGPCGNQEALLLPSVASRAALSRWALVPSPVRADLLHDEACGADEVVVRHTFLHCGGTPEVTPKRRNHSAPPPPNSCDRQADTLCALTYRLQPVDPVALANAKFFSIPVGSEEEAPSDSTATPIVASAAASEATSEADHQPMGQEVGDHRAGLSTLPSTYNQQQSPGDFLLRACAQSVSDWQNQNNWAAEQHQGGGQPQYEACAVPRDSRGVPTSIGSIGHLQGMCKPCVFAHHAAKVCMNGVTCPFCHFEHPPKQKRRLGRQRPHP